MIKINLSRLIGERKMTQKEVAMKTDIRPNTIGKYYHESIDRVNLEHLDKLCEVLQCDLHDLLQRVYEE